MEVVPTDIPEVLIIRPRVFRDPRGFFVETWNRQTLADVGLAADFVQDNHSRSSKGTLRGLHYQIEQAQGKLVRAAAGTVFDVAVDLRRSSPTFGRWVGIELSDENQQMLWIPPGFAHGFLVLSETADFQYKCTDYYAPQHERTIQWNDPALSIAWPSLPGTELLLSARDQRGTGFSDADTYQ